MEPNYKGLGFKAGLEIHQQLDTHKLFCDCPSVLRSDPPFSIVKRKIHVVAGESGEVDATAKFQGERDIDFLYETYDTTCLVEIDEEPPHEINSEALKTVLEISLLLNCKIFPLSQVMRKTIVNGSNTSGFQRTVLIAHGGFIETSEGKVGINSIYLEEDSARTIEKKEGSVVYRLDRLGIPLVEISTDPDLKSANQVKESALKIGEILRSTKVRRGIGTIRQDLNISIKGSNRVEIKGFQDPKIMEKCIELEVLRQKEILDSNGINSSEVRNCLPDGTTDFLRPMPGSARMYPETDLPLLHISRELINEVKKNLPKLKEEIAGELTNHGLSEEMIKLLFKKNKVNEYKDLYEINGNPKLVSKILLLLPKEISKKKKKSLEDVEKILSRDVLLFVLESVYKEKIQEKDVKYVLEKIVEGVSPKEAIKLEKEDFSGVEEKIMKIIKEKPGLSSNAYMGLVMKEFNGKISGDEAMKIIEKFLE
ncbi:Glu-tRNA(Gln) amidotransferase GatDE subunit E [Candidatus Pacearchaeota archaeon CG10_big_fil_rev_8_21_14_0_10_32_42]|nr:MAG: Glu-tRNA(Gln) amidotransferase GatDE subunit E [Candidatus Pacearchaeota archaeon CG10_big_fil_rev_8_21_14_0_10_32_42]